MAAHDFSFSGVDGTPLPLSAYRGKAVLVVNTASACGFTPQYAALQALWERYRERGLVVVAVPSNDFGQQEPGTDDEIQQFCQARYGVTFPVAAKQHVTGGAAHPFYRWVEREFGEGVNPRWNFHKYLVDGDGNLAGAWPSRVDPLSEELTAAVEEALPRQ